MPTYLRSACVVFFKVDEPFGGLSNMAGKTARPGGFPLRFAGHDYLTSEHLYQCLRFPEYPDIQASIRAVISPMRAKMHTRPFRATHSRTDWDAVCKDVMRYCLRLKLHTYEMSFGRLLCESQGRPIVEESRRPRNDQWSARALQGDPDVLVGENTLGLLLMELRDEFLALPPGGKISLPDAGWLLPPASLVAA